MGEQLSVERAAARLGLTRWGVYRAVERGDLPAADGRPLRLDAGAVAAFGAARRAAALGRLVGRGEDLVVVAARVRRLLRPVVTTGVRPSLSALGDDVRAVFGQQVLAAAALPDEAGCRWCAARVAARLVGVEEPVWSPALVELLGGPCERDGHLVASALEGMRRRVHGPVVGPRVPAYDHGCGCRCGVHGGGQ